MMVAPCAISNRLSKRGSGYASLMVMALIPLQSTTYLLLPSFLGTKKVGTATSDRDGHIIPTSCNSCKVSNSACCSALVSRYLFAGFGSCFSHPSIKLILKFQSPLSFGIFLALRSLNPSRYSWSSIGDMFTWVFECCPVYAKKFSILIWFGVLMYPNMRVDI